MSKSRDLEQSFQRLVEKYNEFIEESTMDGMERTEIESVIQQIDRLHNKLNKFMNIVGRKFSK
jgi:methanogenic corrinoid protein MtbC1